MAKIFSIGHPRSGTTSLHAALNMLKIKSIHNDEIGAAIRRNAKIPTESPCNNESIPTESESIPKLLKGLEMYLAYCDFVWPFFERLDKDYPNSLFICTYRNPSEIALSGIQHGYKHKIITPFFSNYSNLYKRAINHYDKVFKYFSDKQDRFLIIRICDGDGWEKLCPFLGMSIPSKEFPWKKSQPSADKKRAYSFKNQMFIIPPKKIK